MGQAKNRKSEIDALKANGSKKITPFIIRGSIQDGKVGYDTTGLEPAQAAFVDGCVKSINENVVADMPDTPEQATHLTFVSWNSPEDFIGMLTGPFDAGHTPDSVYADALMRFNKHHAKFPQVGFTYTRDEIVELGTEQAGLTYDIMGEGSIWPWPNAHAVFQKRGDKLVVIKSI